MSDSETEDEDEMANDLPSLGSSNTTKNTKQNMIDIRIIATAEDAILAKNATAQANYYRDPFCQPFCDPALKKTSSVISSSSTISQQQSRRYFQPIIKRGTHARVCCMDRALTAFLKVHATMQTKKVEVIVLGAGKDTSYWRFVTKTLMGMEEYLTMNLHRTKASAGSSLPPLPKVQWKEVDHPSVIHEKASIIQRTSMLSQCCPNLRPTSSSSSSSSSEGYTSTEGNYQLIGADLRQDIQSLMDKLGLNPKIPTLFLVECVFMYLPTKETVQGLLHAIATSHPRAWMALYEPILKHDTFGQIMERNLIHAQVATPECGLLQVKTLRGHLELLVQSAGFIRAVGCDMSTAYQTIVTMEQRKKASQAEFLDEVEEWTLIMNHYCFILATTCQTMGKDSLTQVHGEFSSSSSMSSPLGFTLGKCEILSNQERDDDEL